MEHPDLAQLAAVGGALGSAARAARPRARGGAGGLIVLGVSGRSATSLGTGSLDRSTGATGLAAAFPGVLVLGVAAPL